MRYGTPNLSGEMNFSGAKEDKEDAFLLFSWPKPGLVTIKAYSVVTVLRATAQSDSDLEKLAQNVLILTSARTSCDGCHALNISMR